MGDLLDFMKFLPKPERKPEPKPYTLGDLDYTLVQKFGAFINDNVKCPRCKDGQILLEGWKNPRPCDICRGAGQVSVKTLERLACELGYCEDCR